MIRLVFGVVLLSGIGCAQMQPVGPLAKFMGQPKGAATPVPGTVPEPASVPQPVGAVRPTPPAMLITPGEVSPDTADDAARRLRSEFEADHKTMPTPPTTAEISVIKGGVKQ